ncbi:urate hydroxylase PuuD [Pseudohaliea sp.]|uniref:urate hydroxylase PuuD n=1 Tax=Pseudohaliea sp. TaxID=2740289 RepID=UPI0032EF3419
MEATLWDLAALLVRWAHLIFGIAWIGASFYFIWLDNSLQAPPPEKAGAGVAGDLWSFHGGGIYEVSKYRGAPPAMPDRLHWFYWEAYATWLSGFLLLCLVYYLQAPTLLAGEDTWVPGPGAAVLASLLFLAAGVAVYEVLLRSPLGARQGLFAGLMVAFTALVCWLAFQLFAPRAAALHVGMLLGTVMAGNVFLGIIPAQRAFVHSLESGGAPPLAGLAQAKLRSTHNNYFTLPVLLCMISNHYPVLYGHRAAPLLLFLLLALAAFARHFFNLRHRGIVRPAILVIAFAGFLAVAGWLAWDGSRAVAGAGPRLSDAEALALVQTHCTVCHAQAPSWPGMAAAPLGLELETLAAVDAAAARAATALGTGYMPLGNVTAMADAERAALLAWLRER